MSAAPESDGLQRVRAFAATRAGRWPLGIVGDRFFVL
jgi:hypothetical protein